MVLEEHGEDKEKNVYEEQKKNKNKRKKHVYYEDKIKNKEPRTKKKKTCNRKRKILPMFDYTELK